MGAPPIPPLPMTGRNMAIVVMYGGAPIVEAQALCLKWDVEQVTVDFRDGYAGADNKRVDQQTDGFNMTGDFHVASIGNAPNPGTLGISILDTLEAIRLSRNANQAQKELAIGFVLSERSGLFKGCTLKRCAAKWKLANSDQAARAVLSLTVMAEDFQINGAT